MATIEAKMNTIKNGTAKKYGKYGPGTLVTIMTRTVGWGYGTEAVLRAVSSGKELDYTEQQPLGCRSRAIELARDIVAAQGWIEVTS